MIRWSLVAFTRFIRRLRHAFRWEVWSWKYESCQRCGSCFRMPGIWLDGTWNLIADPKATLCVDCFLVLAYEKGIRIDKEDIQRLYIFNPGRPGTDLVYNPWRPDDT